MTAVDLQKHAVYVAEHRWMAQIEPETLSHKRATDYLRMIQMTSVWKSLSPSAGAVILKTTDESVSKAESGSIIKVSTNHLQLPVLIHEMTHALIMRVFGPTTLQAHGPQFVSIYRMFVEELTPEWLESWDETFDHPSIKRDDRRVRQRQRFATAAEV